MAQQNNEDIRMMFAVQTTGTEQIQALKKQVQTLADAGGDAAPVFQKLAEELGRIEEQVKAVQVFNALQTEITQTGAAMDSARQKAATLKDTLREQSSSVSELKEKQAAAAATIQEYQTQLVNLRTQLNTLKKDSDEATKRTDEYKRSVLELNRQMSPLENSLAQQRVALTAIKGELKEAAASTQKTATAYKAAVSEVSKFDKTLGEQNVALGETKATMASLGLSVENFADAEKQVIANTERVVAAIRAESKAYHDDKAAIEALAQATERLAAEQRGENELLQLQAGIQAHATAESQKLAEAKRQEAEAQKQAAAATQQALQDAYGKVGLGSVQRLEQELREVREAMLLIQRQSGLTGAELSRAMDMGNRRVKELELNLRRARSEMTLMDKGKDLFKSFGAQVGFGVTAVQSLVEAVKRLGIEFWEANTGQEKWRRGLLAIYKDSAVASQQLDVLRKVANDAGVEVSALAPSFVKFAASAKDAGVPMQTVNGLFAAITKNAAMLGQSGDDVNRMLTALGQMASKGTVQMEELKQQLGDALPGALPKLAKALGLTQAELMKLVETGGLMAEDAFPALQKVLEETTGGVNTMTATWERFKNMFAQGMQDLGDAGLWEALKVGLNVVGIAVATLVQGVQFLFDAVFTNIKGLAIAIVGFTNGEFKQTLARLDKLQEDFFKRQAKHAERYGQYMDSAGRSIAASFGDAKAMQEQLTASTDLTTQSSQRMADAVQTASVAIKGQSESIHKSIIAMGEANKEADKHIHTAKALAEAKKIEGQTLEAIANLTGDEVAKRNAATLAAQGNAKALEELAVIGERSLDVAKKNLTVIEARYLAEGKTGEQHQKQLQNFRDALALRDAETQKLRQSANAAQAEVQARTIASQTYLDNSARLGELQRAYENTTQYAEMLTQAVRTGLLPQSLQAEYTAKATEAQRQAAVAQAMYRDAIDDTVAAAERQKNGAQLLVQVAGESQFALNFAAQASNNYTQALDLTAQAAEREAAASQKQIEFLRQMQARMGDPEGKYQLEIDRLSALSTAKEAEAEKSRQSTQAARDEAAARQLAADTYKDNSDKLIQYAGAARAAEEDLRRLAALHAQGRASAEDVAEATRKAARAQALYKDALNDTNSKLQAQIALQQALSNERTASLKLELEQARTAEQVAKARGDENAAIQAQIRQKQIEKQIRAESARAARSEADAIIAAAEAELREARTTGTLTPIKQQEIEARIANARAKKIEAATTDETINQLNSEIGKTRELISVKQDLRNTNNGGTNGSGPGGTGGGDSSTSGSRFSNYGSNGSWRRDDGSLIGGGGRSGGRAANVSAMQELQQKKRMGLLTGSDLSLAEAAWKAAEHNYNTLSNLGAGWADLGAHALAKNAYVEAKNLYEEVKAMSEQEKKSSTSAVPSAASIPTQPYQQDLSPKSTGISPPPTPPAPPSPPQPPAPTGSSSHHTLTFNYPGGQATIGTASEADSMRLKQVLTDLLKEAGRSA